jgi:adenylate cyclase
VSGARRLAAVMFTDLVDYTGLSQRDEARTLALLGEHRSIVRALLPEFGGREVKTTGDGFLVEFDSALHATLCAVEIQARCQAWRNEHGGDRPFVRIGIHVGDVVHEGGDILGDAVNLASRIEPLAPPGGIAVSGAVYEQVTNKVPHKFDRLPTPVLKGVHSPLEVYRLLRAGAEAGPTSPIPPAFRVAVLPLASISPDPRDEYLADGMTDEIIHGLSQLGGLRVIARTSVEHYRGASKPLPQVGYELNVQSVIEGSVRRLGNQLRIRVQLTDVPSQSLVWSEQYERGLDDVFGIQSEIALRVAESLRVHVADRESTRLQGRPALNGASYLAYLKGRRLLRHLDRESPHRAYAQFEEACRLDATNGRAYAGMADAAFLEYMLSGAPLSGVGPTLARCKELLTRSLSLEPNAAESHASLAHLLDESYEFAPAERELRTAIALNPSLATAHRWYARLLTEKGELERALEELRIAEEADPMAPDIQSILARTLLSLHRPDEAAAKIHRLAELEPEGMRLHYARFEQALEARDPAGMRREADWFMIHDPNGTEEERRAYWSGLCYAVLGEREKARDALAALRRTQEGGTGRLFEWASEQMAEIQAVLGEVDDALALIRSAFRAKALSLELWQTRPSLEPLRRDARFAAFLREVGLA